MPLEVYRSSAGTGKTTTLVSEYLRISLDKPNSFRKVLAITFTNKAANEMKSRVIEVLRLLSENPDAVKDEYSSLLNYLNLGDAELKQRASLLLSLILHNYDDFAISTIDSFIHKIIRTFANDVNLPQNFEVVIDIDDFLSDIIALLYNKVGSDKQLTRLLVDFVISNAEEESSYDPTRKLTSFILYQLREDSFKFAGVLQNLDIERIGDIIGVIRSYMMSGKNKAVYNAQNALYLIAENNIDDGDFFNGQRGIVGFFKEVSVFKVNVDKLFPGKLAEKTINEGKWTSSKVSQSTAAVIESISSELTELYNEIVSDLKQYLYYSMVFSKIYSVALVNEIRKIFDDYTDTTGKVHISEFNKRISEEIAGQPVPYIFERLGSKYRYFLIDEFQDTSVLQWNNLLPLIEESLSQGNFNMLVGDAKQAIYRFRSGEVELFARLPELYGITDDSQKLTRQKLIESEFKEVPLSVNWRSEREIVEFNNRFFEAVSSTMPDYIRKIYEGHVQEVPEHKMNTGGFVSLNLIEVEDKDEYSVQKNHRIFSIIKDLRERNYRLKDICILCRTAKGAGDISAYLLENKTDVVSSESLLLANSPKVRWIINILRLVRYPADALAIAGFVQCFTEIHNELQYDQEYNRFAKSIKSGLKGIFSFLGIEDQSDYLVSSSVYEMSEFIIRSVIGDSENDPFLQNFLDFAFENNDIPDKFLELWDKKSSKLFITMPEDLDAVKVMTIHKAKGLKFPVVILETSGVIERNTVSEYWEPAAIPGADDLKVTLMPLRTDLSLIDREEIYLREKEKTELDNLNLVYVAFTRPVEALYTVSKTGGRKSHLLSRYILSFLEKEGIEANDNGIYNFGEPVSHVVKETDTSNRIILDKLLSCQWENHIVIAESKASGVMAVDYLAKNEYGSIVHDLLADVFVADDVDRVISAISDSGVFSESDCNLFRSILLSVVTHDELSPLFSEASTVRNESEILLEDGRFIRPDKLVFSEDKIIIVDYKTGLPDEKHHQQMKSYEDAVSGIFNRETESMLVYLGDEINIVKC